MGKLNIFRLQMASNTDASEIISVTNVTLSVVNLPSRTKESIFDSALKSSMALAKKAEEASAAARAKLDKAQEFMSFMVLGDFVKNHQILEKAGESRLDFEVGLKRLLNKPFVFTSTRGAGLSTRVAPWVAPFAKLISYVELKQRNVLVSQIPKVIPREGINPSAQLGALVLSVPIGAMAFAAVALSQDQLHLFKANRWKIKLYRSKVGRRFPKVTQSLYYLGLALMMMSLAYFMISFVLMILIRLIFVGGLSLRTLANLAQEAASNLLERAGSIANALTSFLLTTLKQTFSDLATFLRGPLLTAMDILARVVAMTFLETPAADLFVKGWKKWFHRRMLQVLCQFWVAVHLIIRGPELDGMEEDAIVDRATLWDWLFYRYFHLSLLSYGPLATKLCPGEIIELYLKNILAFAKAAPRETTFMTLNLILSIFLLARKGAIKEAPKSLGGKVFRALSRAAGATGRAVGAFGFIQSLLYFSLFAGVFATDDDLLEERTRSGITLDEKLIRASFPYYWVPDIRNAIIVIKLVQVSFKTYHVASKAYHAGEKIYAESTVKQKEAYKKAAIAILTAGLLCGLTFALKPRFLFGEDEYEDYFDDE